MDPGRSGSAGPDLEFERRAWASGRTRVAGVDEVGRGALAGPIVAAAVVLGDREIPGLRDSKSLTPNARRRLAAMIKRQAFVWAVHEISAERIDALGLQEANIRVLRGALGKIASACDFALVDGYDPTPCCVPTMRVVKGDERCRSIAAASVLAKVHRDELMAHVYEKLYPGYDFASNKGYGSANHLVAINQRGICAIHRRSFAPCGDLPEAEGTDKNY